MSDCCTPVEAEDDKNATIESCCTPAFAAKENGSAQLFLSIETSTTF